MTPWFPPQGADVTAHGVRYFVWAPGHMDLVVEVYTDGGALARTVPLVRDKSGYFHGTDPLGSAGDLYKIHLDADGAYPAPGSHWLPQGVHGPSAVVDPRSYRWQDSNWQRPLFRDLVIYELHIGTFTPEGTFRAAIGKLPHLQSLGITAIELMPVADFPGDRNWGYDGVQPYAPARCYGGPDDLRALVDAAHQAGIAVILDVVYNHFGPDGNYLGKFSAYYFESDDQTPWGSAINFGRERNQPVRDFFTANVLYWMDQFHIDGFRLDATHQIFDASPKHILAEISELVHERGGYVIAEDERNDARLVTPASEGGLGLDGLWADDFHHIVEVALIDASVYRGDFRGELRELVEALRQGWLYCGQHSVRHGQARGTPCGHLSPERFIFCISNHDQVGNRALGERLNHLVSASTYRAASALLLLAPYTPLLFMGQEWAASSPFQYFTDHEEELGKLVEKGRREEFRTAFANATTVPSPQTETTFLRSKLNWEELRSQPHAGVLALYQELLRIRRANAVFRPVRRGTWQVEIVQEHLLAMRLHGDDGQWLVLCDLRGGHSYKVDGEEFLRPPEGRSWELVLATDERRFGGERAEIPKGMPAKIDFVEPELMVFRG